MPSFKLLSFIFSTHKRARKNRYAEHAMTLLYNNASGNLAYRLIKFYGNTNPYLQIIKLIVPKKILGAVLHGVFRLAFNISSRVSSFNVWSLFKKPNNNKLLNYVPQPNPQIANSTGSLNVVNPPQIANSTGSSIVVNPPTAQAIRTSPNLEQESLFESFIRPVSVAIDDQILSRTNVNQTFDEGQVDTVIAQGSEILNNLRNQNSGGFWTNILGVLGLGFSFTYITSLMRFLSSIGNGGDLTNFVTDPSTVEWLTVMSLASVIVLIMLYAVFIYQRKKVDSLISAETEQHNQIKQIINDYKIKLHDKDKLIEELQNLPKGSDFKVFNDVLQVIDGIEKIKNV